MRSLALAVLLVALPCHAYVQTRTDSGTIVHWPQSCVVLQPDARGDQSSDNINIDDINGALSSAVANWNGPMGGCTYMRLGVVEAYQPLEPISDGRPSVVFRSDTWNHDASVIALTTVWFSNRPNQSTDGLIADADIELNAVSYTFTVNPATDAARPGTMLADLENTLTHEVGHVLGLAHTCWDHVLDEPPLDNNGNPAPDCRSTNLPSYVTEATMYPYAQPGSTSMEHLSADDIAGICDNYSSADKPTACYGDIMQRGCAVAPRAPESAAAWLLCGGALLALFIGRRARRGSL